MPPLTENCNAWRKPDLRSEDYGSPAASRIPDTPDPSADKRDISARIQNQPDRMPNTGKLPLSGQWQRQLISLPGKRPFSRSSKKACIECIGRIPPHRPGNAGHQKYDIHNIEKSREAESPHRPVPGQTGKFQRIFIMPGIPGRVHSGGIYYSHYSERYAAAYCHQNSQDHMRFRPRLFRHTGSHGCILVCTATYTVAGPFRKLGSAISTKHNIQSV